MMHGPHMDQEGLLSSVPAFKREPLPPGMTLFRRYEVWRPFTGQMLVPLCEHPSHNLS